MAEQMSNALEFRPDSPTMNHYQAVVAHSPFSTVIYGMDGLPVLANRAAATLWSLSRAEFEMMVSHYNILRDPRLVELGMMPYIEAAFSGEATHIPVMKHHRPSSSAASANQDDFWVSGFAYPIRDQTSRVVAIVVVHQDVTTEMVAKKKLSNSEARYRAIVESTTDCICRFLPDTTLTFVNEAYCVSFGRSRESLLGRKFLDLIPSSSHKGVIQKIESMSLTGQPSSYEHEVIGPDGEIRWQQWTDQPLRSADGRIVEFQSIGRDITEQRKNERALRQSEERYRSIVEDQTEHIVRWRPCGAIRFVNRSYARFLERESCDLFNQSYLDFVADCDRAAFQKTIDALSPERPAVESQRRMVGPNGTIRWHRWTDRAFFGEDGQPIAYQSVGQDITEQKEATERQTAALKEKEVLLREIHHRVKNNLQIVSSLLKLAASRTTDNEVSAIFGESQNRIASMSLVHERLYQSENLARVNYAEYVQEMVAQLFRSYGNNRSDITYDIQVDPVELSLDQAIPCGLVLSELVSNALKHGFSDYGTGRITVCMQQRDGVYHLSVGDNGRGIELSNGQPVKRNLGMQLIETLIEQLEGTLHFDNLSGTRINVAFPSKHTVL